ncbi:MAG: NAD(P)H-dependent glycerol-3-phosphate dehydrogenase [Wolbachia endosymbiont of Tyrophagus putrescentiae]|nr:NAD(P)H-dependent glycerol-3-phosphate dehydrogenase [Wolbachia endosymbiont of Tyrophagus putrescentiae]
MTISILGAGAWGTAIAISLSSKQDIILWTHNKSKCQLINEKRESDRLPGCLIPDNISVKSDIKDTINSAAIIIATPTQSLREVCKQLRGIQKGTPIILACKGIEQSTLMLPSEIAQEILPDNPTAIFSGPSFAIEVAKNLPYSMVLACQDTTLGLKLTSELKQKNMILHFSNDVVSVQTCAALKNVFAIACGIVLGRKLGYNAHAALITKSINEVRTLYLAKTNVNNIDTLLGPSCLGDLVMTCTSLNSRNLSFGLKISNSNCDIQQALRESKSTIEGISTARSTFELAQKLKIQMPICEAIYELLYKNVNIDDIISKLVL